MATREEELAYYFTTIGNAFKKELSLEDFDCSMKECAVLEYLSSGPKTMSELATEMNLTPGTMTVQIDNMVDRKFVERKYDKTDRRKIHIVLSKRGDKLAEVLRNKHKHFAKMMLDPLDPKEQDELVRLLGKSAKPFDN